MTRAQIEIQFNWVMVLVAGALIFLFFFGVIRWVKITADEGQATTAATYLDTLLTSSAVTTSTVTTFRIPISSAEFTYDSFRINEQSSSRLIRNKILYAPSRVEKGSFITWTKTWNVPFRAANFLYLSSPSIRYIIIGDTSSELYTLLEASLPDALTADFNPSTIEDTNTAGVRFVYLDGFAPNSADLANYARRSPSDVSAVHIQEIGPGETYTISYYTKSAAGASIQNWRSAGGVPSIYGNALMLGAIFSGTLEDFMGSRDLALARLRNVGSIYEIRARNLNDGTLCDQYYIQAHNQLLGYPSVTMNDLGLYARNLESANNNLQRYSCVLAY